MVTADSPAVSGDRRSLVVGVAAVGLATLALLFAGVGAVDAPLLGAGGEEAASTSHLPVQRASEASPERVVVASAPAMSSPIRSHRLRVLRADTRAPLPGVEVWVCANGGHDAADLESVCRARGSAVRADANGVAQIGLAGVVTVFARQDGLVGTLQLPQPDAPDLLMHPDRAVTVRVWDVHGGVAAGVRLSAAVPGDGSWYAFGATGDDGVRAWPDFGLFLAWKRAEVPRALRVRASLPGHEGIVLETAALPANGAMLDLRLPATGQVTVRVLDPAGRPALGQWPLQLCAVTVHASGEQGRSRSSGINVVSGFAVIERVPLDGLFEVTMQPSSVVPEIASGVFRGPSAAQPAVEVVMGLPPAAALVRGRAVDGDGRVVRSGRMVLRFVDRANDFKLWAQQLDADGGSLLVVPDASAARPLASAVAQLFPDPKDYRRWISADLHTAAPFQPGITELGDVVFRDFPLLVAGRVVPAPGAACQDFQLFVEHRAPGSEWRGLDVQVHIDVGDFSVLMPPARGDYRLRVVPNARCHIPPEPIPFTPGQRDLAIILDRGHTLELRVRLGARSEQPNTDLLLLRAELRATAGEAARRVAADRDGVPSSGGWRPGEGRGVVRYWNGLVEGTYELRVLAGQRLLRVVPGIRVPAASGGVPEVELDLSAEIGAVTLNVRTPSGEPTRFVLWALSAQGFNWPSHASTATPVRRLVCRGESDLWILAPEYAPVLLRNVDGDRTIVLEPCRATLRVQVDCGGPLPENVGLRLIATAEPVVPLAWDAPPRSSDARISPWASIDESWPASVSARVGRDGSAELVVFRPGPQRLTLEVFDRSGRQAPVDTPLPTVGAVAGSRQSVRLTVPRAVLQR